jgi:hypothetical protein
MAVSNAALYTGARLASIHRALGSKSFDDLSALLGVVLR